MAELQAQANCLLKENGDLKIQSMAKEAKLANAQKKNNEAIEVTWKF